MMHFVNVSALVTRHKLKNQGVDKQNWYIQFKYNKCTDEDKIKIKLWLTQDPTSIVGQFLSFLNLIIQQMLIKSSLTHV